MRIADGIHIGHQWRLGILTVEERFRPEGRISGDGILKPSGIQIIVICATQLSGLYLHTVVATGIRTEPAPLLGVVVLNKTDTATAYTRVLCDDTLHDGLHLVRLLQVTLNIKEVVPDGHRHIRHHIVDGSVRRPHTNMETVGTDFYQGTLDKFVEQD